MLNADKCQKISGQKHLSVVKKQLGQINAGNGTRSRNEIENMNTFFRDRS